MATDTSGSSSLILQNVACSGCVFLFLSLAKRCLLSEMPAVWWASSIRKMLAFLDARTSTGTPRSNAIAFCLWTLCRDHDIRAQMLGLGALAVLNRLLQNSLGYGVIEGTSHMYLSLLWALYADHGRSQKTPTSLQVLATDQVS